MDIKHRRKQLVAAFALAGAVTAGTAGAAVAAEGDTATPPVGSGEVARHPRGAIHALARIINETLGTERGELRAALKGGQSIAEFAESRGQDPQAVVDAVVEAVNGRIDQAVANGRIDAERGETIRAKVAEHVGTLVNRHFGQV